MCFGSFLPSRLGFQLPEDSCIPTSIQDIRSLTLQPAGRRTSHSWHIIENARVHSDSSLCDEEDEKAEDVREERQEENHDCWFQVLAQGSRRWDEQLCLGTWSLLHSRNSNDDERIELPF